jgi:hypothetical protein
MQNEEPLSTMKFTEPGKTDRLELPADPSSTLLSDLPPSIRANPLFRQGYNRGYSDRAHAESWTDRRTREALSATRAANRSPIFDVTAGGLRHRLAPGLRAMRDLSILTTQSFTTETPCCGRRITLDIPQLGETLPGFCCHCRALFAVGLMQEERDGFSDEPLHVVMFMVEQTDVAIANHRAGKWERVPGTPDRQRLEMLPALGQA